MCRDVKPTNTGRKQSDVQCGIRVEAEKRLANIGPMGKLTSDDIRELMTIALYDGSINGPKVAELFFVYDNFRHKMADNASVLLYEILCAWFTERAQKIGLDAGEMKHLFELYHADKKQILLHTETRERFLVSLRRLWRLQS